MAPGEKQAMIGKNHNQYQHFPSIKE